MSITLEEPEVQEDPEYMDAVIFNKNRLCAVDIRTSGPYCDQYDILQLCIYPLNSKYQLAKNIVPFNVSLLPLKKTKRHPSYSSNDMFKSEFGILPSVASDLLERWCREKLGLSEKKKIIPLAHDWAFQRPFFQDWLGNETFAYLFSKEYRDLLSIILLANDWAEVNVDQVPFPKVHLTYAARQLDIPIVRTDDSIMRCKVIAQMYHHILHNIQGMFL